MSCIFCDFVEGKSNIHANGMPFLTLNETPNTLSFLSIDFPEKEDGHILVIPKKHFANIEDIPLYIRHELIDHATHAAKVLRNTHEGCNILLNNGTSAGQCVLHTHFHIVPRDSDDGIKIEVWKNKKLDNQEYVALTSLFRERFQQLK